MSTDTQARPEPKRAEWQALVHLSVGRRGDRDRAADLVPAGETVWLTEDESARLLDRGHHKVPVIRPATERHEPLPRLSASALFGPKGRPAAPAPIPGAAAALDVTNESRVLRDPGAGREGAPVRQVRRGRPPASA